MFDAISANWAGPGYQQDSWLAGQNPQTGQYLNRGDGASNEMQPGGSYNWGNGITPEQLQALGLLQPGYSENDMQQALAGAWTGSGYSPEFQQQLDSRGIQSRISQGENGWQQGFYGPDGQMIGPRAQWGEGSDDAFGLAMLAAGGVVGGGIAAAGGGLGTTAGVGLNSSMGAQAIEAAAAQGGAFPGVGGFSAAEGNALASGMDGFYADGNALTGGAESSWDFATPEGGYGGGTNPAMTGSDAHFYNNPTAGGSPLGNMGGAGTATIPSMSLGGDSAWYSQLGDWAKANPELIRAGGGLLSAGIGSLAANSAAGQQTSAANAANALQRDQFDYAKQQNAPFISGGMEAFNALRDRLGISGNTSAPGYGSFGQAPTAQQVQSEPGYQFGMNQGLQAQQRLLNARGLDQSGAQYKALSRYGTDYASTKYGQASDRMMDQNKFTAGNLTNLAGMGQASANNSVAAGASYANNSGNNLIGAGNANAANALAQGNLWGGAINQGVSAYAPKKNWWEP